MNSKKITSADVKSVGVPKTVEEIYEKLKKKNPNIELLKDTFGLDIQL